MIFIERDNQSRQARTGRLDHAAVENAQASEPAETGCATSVTMGPIESEASAIFAYVDVRSFLAAVPVHATTQLPSASLPMEGIC